MILCSLSLHCLPTMPNHADVCLATLQLLQVRTLVHSGGRMFSGSYDKTVKAWDVDKLEEIATLSGEFCGEALILLPRIVELSNLKDAVHPSGIASALEALCFSLSVPCLLLALCGFLGWRPVTKQERHHALAQATRERCGRCQQAQRRSSRAQTTQPSR